jgi:hypothetical protein
VVEKQRTKSSQKIHHDYFYKPIACQQIRRMPKTSAQTTWPGLPPVVFSGMHTTPMNRYACWLAVAVASFGLLLGCRPRGVNAAELKSTFKTAEPALKTEADKAVAALKAGKPDEALTILRKLAGRAKLTADQQLAIKNTISQIEGWQAALAAKPAVPPVSRPSSGR